MTLRKKGTPGGNVVSPVPEDIVKASRHAGAKLRLEGR